MSEQLQLVECAICGAKASMSPTKIGPCEVDWTCPDCRVNWPWLAPDPDLESAPLPPLTPNPGLRSDGGSGGNGTLILSTGARGREIGVSRAEGGTGEPRQALERDARGNDPERIVASEDEAVPGLGAGATPVAPPMSEPEKWKEWTYLPSAPDHSPVVTPVASGEANGAVEQRRHMFNVLRAFRALQRLGERKEPGKILIKCPACGTTYRVRAEEAARNDREVRCSRCEHQWTQRIW